MALQSEIQILQMLKHPQIVQYYGYMSYDIGSFAIFMRYMPGVSELLTYFLRSTTTRTLICQFASHFPGNSQLASCCLDSKMCQTLVLWSLFQYNLSKLAPERLNQSGF